MVRLFLVRHGQSEWNALGRWQGQADPPLSDLGRDQAVVASRGVGPVSALFTSPLRRASETAAIIGREIGLEPAVIDDLKERDAGDWTGLTREEIEERWPGWIDGTTPVGRIFSDSANLRRPPRWEKDSALLERALRALDEIHATTPDGDVLVVTHGGLVHTLERTLGAAFARLANLEGRWFSHDGRDLHLGHRSSLLDARDVAVTVPEQL
jgi:probable phosphoglycerate mutase